jgi:hypothetical protein
MSRFLGAVQSGNLGCIGEKLQIGVVSGFDISLDRGGWVIHMKTGDRPSPGGPQGRILARAKVTDAEPEARTVWDVRGTFGVSRVGIGGHFRPYCADPPRMIP